MSSSPEQPATGLEALRRELALLRGSMAAPPPRAASRDRPVPTPPPRPGRAREGMTALRGGIEGQPLAGISLAFFTGLALGAFLVASVARRPPRG